MDETERVLVEKSKAGDLEAFGELVALYQRQVYTVAYRFMGNRDDAWDMAQEAFVRAYQAMAGFRGDCSFRTWVYRIAANACRDELRRRQHRPVASLDEPVFCEEGEIPRQLATGSLSPADVVEKRENAAYLQDLITGLAAEFRVVLVMRDVQGFSYEEIARELDISLGTVKSRLSRARKALRDRIMAERELLPPVARLRK